MFYLEFACLSICLLAEKPKSCRRILTKWSVVTSKNWFDFGGDPEHVMLKIIRKEFPDLL